MGNSILLLIALGLFPATVKVVTELLTYIDKLTTRPRARERFR